MALIAPTLKTDTADILGVLRDDGGCEFRGIKYATADRFAPPVDLSLSGHVDAREYGPISFQTPGFLEQTLGMDSSSMSEDCLSLNVFVPPNTEADAKLPVLFWIHGGAYTNGAGSLSWYHGSHLASRGCVVVTINYRLGIFGFLGTANNGVEDMVSALRWTQRNILHFGGNPDNVTIFGESAGGSAVVTLLATPSATDLFHKAWAMSPSIGQLRSKERAEEILAMALAHGSTTSMSDLQNMSPQQLLEMQNILLTKTSKEYDWFAPTENTETVSPHLLTAAAASPKPFVIGTNKDENKLWAAFDPNAANVTTTDWHQHVEKFFPKEKEHAASIYENHRPGESPHFLMSAVNTDIAFRARAWSLVDDRVKRNTPSWMYWFTWSTPAFGGILGSCHALDIPFAFDNLDAPGGDMFTGDAPERHALATRFADEIAHFATHSHPTWSQYNLDHRPTLQMDTDVTLVSDPESDIRRLLTSR